MVSTNPLPHDKMADSPDMADFESPSLGGVRKRGAGVRLRSERRQTRNKKRELSDKADDPEILTGWPEMSKLKPVLIFLAIPAFFVLAITVTGGGWPTSILYLIALGLGLALAISALRDVELVLAVLLIYLPFSKTFIVPIAPGINGTNMLILLGLFAAVLRLMATRQKLTDFPAGTYLIFAFGFLTSLSAFTVMLLPGGRQFLFYNEILSYKAWVDQFIFYFIALMCVRDIETAKRCAIYVMIGSVLVVLYSVPEMLEKMGRSTIDKSRIGGPHQQSNNFGGFVAYTILPVLAVFLVFIKDVRAWLLTPYFLLTAKVLITTFSRGAYVAMAVGGLMAGYFKGKGFLAIWIAIALSFFLVFPSLIPGSIVARMDTFTEDQNSSATAEDKLDKSSAIRLVMWRAALVMIEEDPIWGKGFKSFPYLKDEYINVELKESDPHNMYLYIGSQMGLPSLSLFLITLGYSFWLGRKLSQHEEDNFIKALGIGGASATACFAVVCIFGSRAVALSFTVYFWTFLVIMQVIRQRMLEAEIASNPKKSRTLATGLAGLRSARHKASSTGKPGAALGGIPPLGQVDENTATGSRKRKKEGANGRGASRGPTRGAAFHQAQVQQSQAAASDENSETRQQSNSQQAEAPLTRKQRRERAFRKGK